MQLDTRTIKIDLAIKVGVVEELHRHLLLALVHLLELGVLDSNILLDVLARQRDLLVSPRTINTVERPIPHCSRDTSQQEHEQIGLEAAIFNDGKERLEDIRNDHDEGSEMIIVEGAVALSKTDKGSVFDSGVVRHPHGGGTHGGGEGKDIFDSATRQITISTLELFGRIIGP